MPKREKEPPSQSELAEAFAYRYRYRGVHGSEVYFVEDGDGDPILFVHGNPTSVFIWRNIIPHLSKNNRCIALDLIGMGRSGVPEIGYRFSDHVRFFEGFIEKLELSNLTLVMQEWGSMLGLHYAMRNEANIKGLVMIEPILKPIQWGDFEDPEFVERLKVFRTEKEGWEAIVYRNEYMEKIFPSLIGKELEELDMAYFKDPFRAQWARKPIWTILNELPIDGQPEDVHKAIREYSSKLQKSKLPKLIFHANPGLFMPKESVSWAKNNLKNLKTVDLGEGHHYFQEQQPDRIGREIFEWQNVS